MAFPKISDKECIVFIEQYKYNLKKYDEQLEVMEKQVVELECGYQKNKLELNVRFSDLKENMSMEILNLNKMKSFLIDKDIFELNPIINLTKYISVLKKCEDMLPDINTFKDNIQLNDSKLNTTLNKENKINEEVKPKQLIVNPHILHSRQTKNPFTVTEMGPNSKYICNGCKETIPLKVLYLRHNEEYPAGSKILRPHSYHIKKECIHDRGFQNSYLSTIKVHCDKEIDDSIIAMLEDIGFCSKNVVTKNDGDSDSDTSDTCSQHSEMSQNPSSKIFYTLRRKHLTQKKKVMCTSCQEEIVPESYLTRGNTFEKTLHIKKKCIQADGISLDDFSRVKCKVYKMLQNHYELTQLTGCGFHFKNIIGNKPPNPKLKNKPIPPPCRSLSATKPFSKDVKFIFNIESFTCERLVHAERCSGCSEQIRKEEIALRHKERIPRDRLLETPLVSQFYHGMKNCLIDRGFTEKYIEGSTCNILLVGSDNLQKVRDVVVRCGFSSDNMKFITAEDTNRQNDLVHSNSSTVERNSSESYLFIVNCSKTNFICEGCRFKINVNEPCFVYGQTCSQDMKARLFHINGECLQHHFTKAQILSMTCINNNSIVDVLPFDIVKCGIVNITTSIPSRFKKDTLEGVKHNPFQSTLPKFVVDNSTNANGVCPACKQPLKLDKYVLRAFRNDNSLPVNMHLATKCVRYCGHLPQQLSQCDVSLKVIASPLAIQRLVECGFRNIPRH